MVSQYGFREENSISPSRILRERRASLALLFEQGTTIDGNTNTGDEEDNNCGFQYFMHHYG